MIRHGQAPFLECSSKGDRRLSAFSARIKGRANQSIEEIFQAAKILADGSTGLTWRQAKGRRAVNQAEVAELYSQLWDEYIDENPELLAVICKAYGLQDLYGQPGHCCQATELWRIRGNYMKTNISKMDWIAIIGSREPKEQQEIAVIKAIEEHEAN